MQLDRTEIVVRARSALELLDLSLVVLKQHAIAIAVTGALLGIPLLILDVLAVAWMLNEDTLFLAERLEAPLSTMRLRHAMHLILLFAMQFPLISLPITVFLGNRIFYEPMPVQRLIRRLWPIAGRCLLILGVLRLGLVGIAMELIVDRTVRFDWGVEFWLIFVLAFIALLLRAVSPFSPEILGLELCPIRASRTGEISYAARSRSLHRAMRSDHLARFAGATFCAVLLFLTLIGAQLFVIGASTGHWQWNAWLDHVGLPITMWGVGLFMAVFRFLSYLDSRIRLEGWEVELRLKAEAARIGPPAKITSGANEAAPSATIQMQIGRHAKRWQESMARYSTVLLVLAAWVTLPQLAIQATENRQVDVRKALQSMPDNSWYDNESEAYVPPDIPPIRDNPLRGEGWLAKKKVAKPANNSAWSDGIASLMAWMALWFPTIIFSLLAVVLIATIGILSYYSLRNYLPSRFVKEKKGKATTIDPARVSELPFEIHATRNDPLIEAERLMRSGRYDEAIVFFYSYLLLALDQARKIHLRKGKTNRMYLRELPPRTRLGEIAEQAMLAFEEVFFGEHSIGRERFLTLWSELGEFHQLLEAVETPSH